MRVDGVGDVPAAMPLMIEHDIDIPHLRRRNTASCLRNAKGSITANQRSGIGRGCSRCSGEISSPPPFGGRVGVGARKAQRSLNAEVVPRVPPPLPSPKGGGRNTRSPPRLILKH